MSKSELLKSQIQYLEQLITEIGNQVNESKITSIGDWEPPSKCNSSTECFRPLQLLPQIH